MSTATNSSTRLPHPQCTTTTFSLHYSLLTSLSHYTPPSLGCNHRYTPLWVSQTWFLEKRYILFFYFSYMKFVRAVYFFLIWFIEHKILNLISFVFINVVTRSKKWNQHSNRLVSSYVGLEKWRVNGKRRKTMLLIFIFVRRSLKSLLFFSVSP